MEYQKWLFDGDGVLYIDGFVQEGASELISNLKVNQMDYALVSNNSTKTIDQYLEMLKSMKLPFEKETIFTSAYVSTKFLRGKSVYIVGETGIFDACTKAGFRIANDTSLESVDNVLVGMDRFFDYQKMTEAMKYIMAGAFFVGTNPDVNFPTNDGFTPGAGTMIVALETASERKVDVIVGKPNRFMFEEALGSTPQKKAVMVGDRFETDILGAHSFGLDTILIRTGIGSRYTDDQIEQFKKQYGCPKYVVTDLEELTKEFIS